MISRRNIRVKVMQRLYTLDSISNEVKPGETVALLKKQLDLSHRLFVYLVYFLTEVARYAERDALHKASKHLPTANDLNINTKIAGNELFWKITEGRKPMPSTKKSLTEEQRWQVVNYIRTLK